MSARTGKWVTALVVLLGNPLVAQTHPDLGKFTDYPVAAEVWIGSLLGSVSVNPEFPIEENNPGEFIWKVADGQQVTEKQVIGLTAARAVELSARDLELKKDRYRNAVTDIEFAVAEKKRTLVNSIRELEDKLARMTMTKAELELLGRGFEARLAKERAEVESDLKQSRAKLTGDYFDQDTLNERRTLDLDLAHAEFDHQELLRSSEILAPTSGKVMIDTHDAIRKVTTIGRIMKEGLAEVRLEMTDVRVRNIPSEDLEIEIFSDDGRSYRGKYLRTLDEKTRDQNARILIFEVQRSKDNAAVPDKLNGSRMLRVYRLLEKPGRIVPKNDLVFKFPQEISSGGWAAFIEKRWSGVKVTYVAPKVLVVNSAHEN